MGCESLRSPAFGGLVALAVGVALCSSTLLWGALAWGVEKRASALAHALASITAEDLQAGVDYVADDAMAGRDAGSPGCRVVGDFLASFLRQLGLKPAGDNGSYFQEFGPGYRNVLGLLEGDDPKLRRQTVVIHAHYDHVGYGYRRSLGGAGQLHNGADDNASGVAATLRAADAFVILGQRPKRSVLFAFFDAEERGLLGSRQWVKQPTLHDHQVVFAIALDMIGRLRNAQVDVHGVRTGYGLRRLLAEQNADGRLRFHFDWNVKPKSDFFPFASVAVPSLLITTGVHADYHRPSDKPKTINSLGMQDVTRMVFQLAHQAAEQADAPRFRREGLEESSATERGLLLDDGSFLDRFGAAWRDRDDGPGAVLTRIADDSPAQRAELTIGDQIVAVAGRAVRSGDEFGAAIRSATSPTALSIQRPGEATPRTVSVALNGAPIRVGVSWRLDDAEPGTVLLLAVLPGSPAARAGLQPGDRVLQIGGRDFVDEAAFAARIRAASDSIDLLIERGGQLHRLTIQLGAAAVKRAA